MAPLIVVGAALLFLLGVAAILLSITRTPSIVEERLGYTEQSFLPTLQSQELSQSFYQRVIIPLVARLTQAIARRLDRVRSAYWRGRLISAGLKLTPGQFYVIRYAVGILFLVLGVVAALYLSQGSLVTGVLVIVLALVAADMAPKMWLTSKVRQRQSAIRKGLPNAIDILVTGLSSGASVQQVFLDLSGSLPPKEPVGVEMERIATRINAGEPTADAMLAVTTESGVKEFVRFARAVIGSAQRGTSITKVLEDQAVDMRRARIQRLEERAHKAPIYMLPPMVGCIMPALLIVLLGPAVLAVAKTVFAH